MRKFNVGEIVIAANTGKRDSAQQKEMKEQEKQHFKDGANSIAFT